MSQPSSKPSQPPLLQQAPVVPLDASGFLASIVGTVLFALATIISVRVTNSNGWMYVFATGTGIGILLIPYTAYHRYWRAKKDAKAAADSVKD